MDEDAAWILDRMADFDGHNGFMGAGGKVDAVRQLRRLARLPDPPSPDEVEESLVDHPRVHSGGPKRARKLYEEIRRGVRHRGPGGQAID